MQRIVVLNPKGGSGKTTIATNLASYYARRGSTVALMDYDSQASASRWLSNRPPDWPRVHAITAHRYESRTTRSWQMRVPPKTEQLIVDTPAAMPPQQFPEITSNADAILIPVLPSDIDLDAAQSCLNDLRQYAGITAEDGRVGIVANRIRTHTLLYRSLVRRIRDLGIPVVASLKDSQVYLQLFDRGLGLFDIKRARVGQLHQHWTPLLNWLDERARAPGQAIHREAV